MPPSIAILCSGQGTQHREMFALTAAVPNAAKIFDSAAELLGEDPRIFVQQAPEAKLFENYAGQLLCCTQALALWTCLDITPAEQLVFAGYSVGELATWGCSGMIDPAALLKLVSRRAQLMDQAAPADSGLGAITGLRLPALQPLLDRYQLQIAIRIGSDSFVVGGHSGSLRELCDEAKRNGASKAVMLHVAVPSHTPLLAAASPPFLKECLDSRPNMPREGWRVLSGIDGDAIQSVQQGCEKLAKQISQTVDWSACMQACHELGATTMLELGPGSALAHMAAKRFPDIRVRSAEDFRTIQGVRDWLAKAG